MLEDDLLARFAALRAPQTPPDDPSSSTAQPSGSVEEQARKKQEEDEEVERIANGMPSTSLLESNTDREDEDEELVKRMARLRGDIETSVDRDDDADVSFELCSCHHKLKVGRWKHFWRVLSLVLPITLWGTNLMKR